MLHRVLSNHNTSAATTAADLEYAAVAVTVASGTTAPALSRTVPLMTPFWTCGAKDAAAKTKTKKMLARVASCRLTPGAAATTRAVTVEEQCFCQSKEGSPAITRRHVRSLWTRENQVEDAMRTTSQH